MMKLRRSEERGHADHGWLDSYHTFSFANYHDPEQMGFRSLRVINDDRVAAGRGFGAHAHRDMEILTYVLDGQLAHKDSMGHTELLGPNEIQKMSAGSGVVHSEFNGSASDPVHFLQIWIEPQSRGTSPNYEQYAFQPEEKRNQFRLLASDETVAGAARLNQDARVSVAEVTSGNTLTYALADRRHAWVHVVEGEVTLNGEPLTTGDAVAVEDERELSFTANGGKAVVLVFDLA
jgi:redox-sensitive bicupin YhaK (pirin superfamily)